MDVYKRLAILKIHHSLAYFTFIACFKTVISIYVQSDLPAIKTMTLVQISSSQL